MFKSWIFFPVFWRTMHALLYLSKPLARTWWFLLFFSAPVLRLPHWTLTKSPTAYWILAESSLLQLWLQAGLWVLLLAGAAFLPLQCPSEAQWKAPSTTTSTSTTTTRHSSRGWWSPKACQFSWAKVKVKRVAAPRQRGASMCVWGKSFYWFYIDGNIFGGNRKKKKKTKTKFC